MAIADQLADYLTSLRFEDLPAETVHAAKRLILDTLGAARAGAAEPGCAEVIAAMAAIEGGASESGGATMWANGQRTSPAAAALINGTCAAALDYDSLHFAGIVHPEIVTLPAALAMAEREGCSGRDLILAVVAGSDLMCRIALSTERNSAWFGTSSTGAFGAAAAAGIALKLNARAMRDALGLALCQASGTRQAIVEKTLAKRMQSAFAARNGVYAAELARHGISGPAESLEGEGGYYTAFEAGNPAVLLDGLGKRFETGNIGIKKYPSCACNHAAIEAASRLVGANGLKAKDVKDISVRITPFMNTLVGAPFDPGVNPQVAAQFSVQYSVAAVLMRGEFKLDDITPKRVCDADIGRLARSITVEVDNQSDGMLAPSTVRLAAGGRVLEETVRAVPGSADAPLSDAEVMAKFRDCLGFGSAAMPGERAEALAQGIAHLDQVERLDDFMAARLAA
jgi:2-methylcitrate dehydratase PrpD